MLVQPTHLNPGSMAYSVSTYRRLCIYLLKQSLENARDPRAADCSLSAMHHISTLSYQQCLRSQLSCSFSGRFGVYFTAS